MKKFWKPPGALTAITGLLSLAVLGVWGACMYCATAITAEYAAQRYLSAYQDFASTLSTRSLSHWLGKGYDEKYANYEANRMWEAVDMGGWADTFYLPSTAAEGSSGFLNLPESRLVYSAAAIYDGEGNLLVGSWEDFFYFEYLTQEQWTNRQERSGNNARAPIDRAKLTQAGLEIVQSGDLTFDAQALRLTGSFDGVTFTPKTIEAVEWDTFEQALRAKGGGPYTVSGVVEDYDLPWISLYEDPDALPPDAETVTFYSDWFDVCWYRPSSAFSYGGSRYEGLDALVAELGPQLSGGLQSMVRYEGLDLIIPSVEYGYRLGDELNYTPYYNGEETFVEGEAQVEFYVVSAVYCSPWRTAWGELRYVYLLTLLLAAGLVLVVRAVIRRSLIAPVQWVSGVMNKTQDSPPWRPELSQAWRESQALQEGMSQWADRLRMQKNEITRLNTALEYAKRAEENRRQMTSNLAHELKTPLAVIHSYAEGLKEHVAEEKRDKYLDVILSEAERTDGMVLEMLDLSRLEAGRVKLSRDEFSIVALTRSILEKLQRLAQAKNLRWECSFPEEQLVIADESRIAQVIENFASNAVKYTPPGGRVAVTIRKEGEKTSFVMVNESKPLSQQALDKVWDTFYREDGARSGAGTGLGLAIAKNIIQLHGGRCWVRNTPAGVEFGFTI